MLQKNKCGIWVRVSDPLIQTYENQLEPLNSWAMRLGLEPVKIYRVEGSAWKNEQAKALEEVYKDAHLREYSVLLVWALDRLARGDIGSAESILGVVHRLGQSEVKVLSLQEPWTDTSSETLPLLLAIASWVSNIESVRRSERVKAGMARAKSQGKTVGRPAGARDKNQRPSRRRDSGR